MSLFKFPHKVNAKSATHTEHSLYYLSEAYDIVEKHHAKRFAVKQKLPEGGFKEFFGTINNPTFDPTDENTMAAPSLLDEDLDDALVEFGLDKPLIITVNKKAIPLYTTEDFLRLSPRNFAGAKRTKDQIAEMGANNRKDIYDRYLKVESRFIESLTDVNCNSVAYLYQYLNAGHKWRTGMEFFGYVDGLFEVGSYLTVAIDSGEYDQHTALHELGHSCSYFLVGTLFDEWYKLAIDKTEPPPSRYGQTEVSEDFAETFGYYYTSDQERSFLKSNCPRRFAFMEKLDRMGKSALIPALFASDILTKRFSRFDQVVYQ